MGECRCALEQGVGWEGVQAGDVVCVWGTYGGGNV